MNSLLLMASSFIEEQTDIHKLNLEKQQRAIDLWNEAKKYPRKKKKQLRIKANKEYNFWVTMDNWHQSLLNY